MANCRICDGTDIAKIEIETKDMQGNYIIVEMEEACPDCNSD